MKHSEARLPLLHGSHLHTSHEGGLERVVSAVPVGLGLVLVYRFGWVWPYTRLSHARAVLCTVLYTVQCSPPSSREMSDILSLPATILHSCKIVLGLAFCPSLICLCLPNHTFSCL